MHKENIFGGVAKTGARNPSGKSDFLVLMLHNRLIEINRDAHLPITPHGPWPKQMICIVGNYDDYDCDNGDDGISLRETPCVI